MEDLHWVDPTTLEFLTLLIDQGPTVPILTVLTCRPEFQPPWGLRAHITPMALPRLSPRHVETMVVRLIGEKALPPEMLQQLLVKTDGVPLFVEELTNHPRRSPAGDQRVCRTRGGAGLHTGLHVVSAGG